jgi:lipopolysaccharide export system protein LptA
VTAAAEFDDRAMRRTAVRLAKLRRLAFRKARRHTWTVRSLRAFLPMAIVGMVGWYGALVYAKVGFKLGGGTLKVQKIEITADDLKMKGVTYDGVTKDGGRYDVRATEAQVDISQKGPVRLSGIDGDLKQLNGVKTNLKSTRGILDNEKGEMDLYDGVVIDASNGLKARMKSAKVFNKENRVIAKEGVVADTATGRIAANAMELQTKERKGLFTGDVAVRLTPDATSTKSALGGATGKDARLPIDMRANKLDFDDNAKLAIFSGGVTAVQGESQLAAATLRVTYEGRANVPGLGSAPPGAPKAAAPALPAAGNIDPTTQATRLSKLQASGQIVITQGADRRITAETMDLDVPADTAVFAGPAVEVQQGQNRLLGRRLEVDRKNGKSRLTSPADGKTPVGRIRTVFIPQQKVATVPGKSAKAAQPATAAPAQSASGFMAFKTDANAPMDIEAETLDVNDQTKQAIYRKAVRAQQGDFIITAAEVVATYTGDTSLMSVAEGEPQAKGQSPQISRVEANDNVVITSKDGQEARSKKAVFDAKSNTVVMTGNVMVKQGQNEISGTRLKIDMTTGIAEFENDGSQPSIGTAAPAATALKSAPGPGGLPQIGGAQFPQGPTPVSGGRQSLTVFPDTIKKGEKGGLLRNAVPKTSDPSAAKSDPAAAAPAPAQRKPASDAWAPTTSPSPIYRSQ